MDRYGFEVLLFMNAVYWTFEYVSNSEYFNKLNLIIGLSLIKSLKLAIARLVLFISLILANFSWSRGPLCVKLELSEASNTIDIEESDDMSPGINNNNNNSNNKTATILGYGNVYGSSYFCWY